VSAGFLLDRARLVVAPTGLEEVVERFTGGALLGGGAAVDFARDILVRLRDVLRQDGRQSLLDTCVDGSGSFTLPADAAPLRDVLRVAGSLHTAAASGTLTLHFPAANPPQVAEATDWLHQAWQRSDVVRLRFVGCQ
jgi:hypothetical protein